MDKPTSCIKCDSINTTVCQNTHLCADCYYESETVVRIQENEASGTSCPSCGSANYSEGTYYEYCYNCGHEQGY